MARNTRSFRIQITMTSFKRITTVEETERANYNSNLQITKSLRTFTEVLREHDGWKDLRERFGDRIEKSCILDRASRARITQ